jgi:hypothetical protein
MHTSLPVRSICAALLVIFLTATGAGVHAQGIYVPEPRDSGGGSREEGTPDIVHIRGDYPALKGQMVAVDVRGRLRLRAPFLATDALLLTEYISHVTLNPEEADGGRDRLTLSRLRTNWEVPPPSGTIGDYISGELVSIGAESVLIETGGGRLVNVLRNVIFSIEVGGTADLLLDSQFDGTDMRPWKVIQGTWRSGDGSLVSFRDRHRRNTVSAVAADVAQKNAVTIETEFVLNASDTYHISFFSSDKKPPHGKNAVSLSVSLGRADVRVTRQGVSTLLSSLALAVRQNETVKLLCSYEPKTGRVRAWINGKGICDGTHPAPFLKEGTSVVLSGGGAYSATFRSVRIHRGVMAPTGRVDIADPVLDCVMTVNGDRMLTKSLEMSKNRVVVETEVAPVSLDMSKVSRIVFRSERRVTPEVGAADATMLTAGSRLTVKLTNVTSERAVGNSPVLGKVDIPRHVLKELRFIAPFPTPPPPVGNGDAAVEPAAPAKDAAGTVGDGEPVGDDTVYVRGDYPAMRGSVVSVDGRGRLRLHTPFFATDALLLVSQINRVSLKHTMPEAGRLRVMFSNGDYIAGELLSIDADSVSLKIVGDRVVKVPRGIVISISATEVGAALLDSNFDAPSMLPWKPIASSGSWRSGGGALIWTQSGVRSRGMQVNAVAAELEQREALTLEVDAVMMPSSSYHISFFATDKTVPTPRTCISVNLTRGEAALTVVHQRAIAALGSLKWSVRPGKKVKVLCSYEPETGRVRAWINARSICDKVIPGTILKEGKYIVVSTRGISPATFSSIRLHRGLVPPTARADRADPGLDSLYTVQGNHITGKSLTVADGKLSVETATGSVTVDLASVLRIILSTEGRTTPEPGNANVTVLTPRSRLSLKLTSMDAQKLTGDSPVFGQVELPRGVVKDLRVIVPE